MVVGRCKRGARWLLLGVAGGCVGVGAACGQAFNASGDDAGSDARPIGDDGQADRANADAEGGSEGYDASSVDAASEEGMGCGPRDAGYNECVYSYCACVYSTGATAFFERTWDCTCPTAGNCQPQCAPSTCGGGYPDSSAPLCGNCLVSQAMVPGPCSFATNCGADLACKAFGDCAGKCAM